MHKASIPLLISLFALTTACDNAVNEPIGESGDAAGEDTDGSDDSDADDSDADDSDDGDSSDGDDSDSDSDGSTDGDDEDEAQGLPILGSYTHSLDNVELDVILDGTLSNPLDLEFNKDAPTELWITNRGDTSVTIINNPGEGDQAVVNVENRTAGGDHFMPKPAALAFGAPGFMATAHQEDQVTQPTTPADFMGPTLWPSDSAVFDAGHATHMDMLHNSPNASGIAWEKDNVYWVFDGYHGSLTRYNFNNDHGYGGADHSDGEIYRAADGELTYVPGIAAHIAYDPSTGLLYSVDPGANRLVVLDTTTGSMGDNITPNYDGVVQRYVDGMELTTLVDGDALEFDLATPSGLELHEDILFITDAETSTIAAFDLDGQPIDWLDTGFPAGTLAGMAFDDAGLLYLVDAGGDRILRISPQE